MLKVILVLLVSAIAGVAYGGTDYQCVNNCTGKGYLYQYCMSQCSYDDNPHQQQPSSPLQSQNPYTITPTPQTDYKCLSDCTSKGYLYQLCKERCSY
jgi:hypothetical protein